MTPNRFASFLRLCLFLILLAGMVFQPQSVVYAAPILTIEPITWNVIGLDSNNVNVGPNDFPVGARVCNESTAGETLTGVGSNFSLANTNPFISPRPGTNTSYSGYTLAAGQCVDFYYEVEVTRTAAAYDTTEAYTITATSNQTGTVSTPTPRELYVEHLVSQSRNAVTNVYLDGAPIPAGGTMNLMVGNTYTITLEGFTATQGYEQLESFINIPNTIFQINSVTFSHSANAGTDPDASTKLYANGCNWENNPNSANYRACLGTGKYGGNITINYSVTILQVPGAPLVNPQPLSTLIYDFSGSSFHYNSDYDLSTRYAYIVNASLTKSFSPKTILPGGTSTLTFTITNPGSAPITNANFTDTLPGGVTLSANVTTPQCGGAITGSAGGNLITVTGATIAANSTCGITITVTSSSNGTYNNTTTNLLLGSTDTGSSGSDTLIVSSQPPPPTSCTTRTTMATWTLENYTASTATNNGPFNAASQAANVSTATGSQTAVNGSASGIANTTTFPTGWNVPSTTGNSGNSWGILGGWLDTNPVNPATATTPYFQFQVDASNYGGIGITASYNLRGNWSATGNWYVLFSTNGTTWTSLNNAVWDKSNAWQINAITGTTTSTGNSTVYFRVFAAGAQYSGNPATTTGTIYLDDITITGCAVPTAPNLSKSFSPTTISTGSTSTLTFTLTNPNTTTALTGVSFTDVLPDGLTVTSGTSTACTTGTLIRTSPKTISLSGGTIAASGSCTINVTVTGAAAGSYTNVTTSVASTATGPNTTPTGIGTSALTVIDPPVIAKAFTANPIFTGNSTALTFSINNPNTSTSLTGVSFTDNLPGGLVVANPNGISGSCGGGTITATPGSNTISLAGATLTGGETCTFSVNVTGTTTGLKTNSVTVTSTNGGTGNTATADVLVKNPTPAISLLKSVGPSNTGPWTPTLTVTLPGSVFYRFVVENIGDVALSGVDINDPNVNTASCSWVDGDGTALVAPFSLPVADANDNQLAICILGPITALDGANPNTATADDNNPGTPTVSDMSTATYTGIGPNLGLAKSNGATSVTAGGTTAYALTVTNSGNAPTSGTITIVDVLPVGLSIANGSVTLGGAQAANWTCNAASNIITCTSSTAIAALGTSTFSFTVNVDANATGTMLNTAQVGGGGDPTNPNPPTSTTAAQCTGTNTPNEGCATDSDPVNIVNLGLAKTNGVTAVIAGATTTYSLTITNNGNVASSGTITIVDVLPAGLSIANGSVTLGGAQAANWSCSAASSVITCTSSTAIAASGTSTYSFTVNVDANASGTVLNAAQVGGGGDPTNPNPPSSTTAGQCTGTNTPNEGCATDTDTVNLVSDLSLTKTVNNTTPNVGANVTFTITVTNAGPSNATNVAVSDVLPAGLAFVSATPSQGSYNSGTGVWTVGALNNGASATLTITATVTTTGAKTNTAQVSASDQTDPDSTPNNSNPNEDDQASVTLTPQVADLSLTKTVNNAAPNVGANVTFTITVINTGPDDATNVAVSDVLPAGLAFVSATPSQGVYNSGTGVWTVGTINNGANATLTITATVTTTGAKTNTAQVSASDQADPDSAPNNNVAGEDDQASVTLTPQIADLSLTKTVNNAAPNVGTNVTFTVTLTNAGPDNATNVAVSDVLPAALTFVSATPSQGSYSSGTGVWTVGTINNGASATLAITATVTTSGAKTNTAQVSASDQADPDSVPGNNDPNEDDQASVTLTPQVADLSLTKTVNNAAPNVGANVTFTITVTNAGPDNATNVAVSDVLPSGLAFVSANPSQGSYSSGTGVWTVGTINNGASATLAITATVTTSGAKTNTAQVSASDQSDPDSTPNNNAPVEDDQGSVVLNPQIADLSLTKTVNNAAPNVGANVTFTITVTNGGPDSATNVSVMDVLPAGLTFVSASPSQGSYSSGTGVWTVGTIANGANATLDIVATVTTAGAKNNYAQVSASDQADPDSTPNDNSTLDDDDDTVTVTPALADLSLTKTVNNAAPNVGTNVTFTITVTNAGPDTATNVAVSDILPAGLAFVSATPSQGTYSSGTGVWTVGTINNGANATLMITATVTTSGAKTNTAQISASDQHDPDSTPNNSNAGEDDQASVTLTPPVADLSLTKTVNNAAPNVGTNVTFTITVTNAGPDNATNVAVSDVLPAGLAFVSATPSQGTYSSGTGVWTVGTINNGANATLTITATVTTSGAKDNYAQVSASDQVDPDSTPNDGSTTQDDDSTVTITPVISTSADLSLTKTVNSTVPNVGANVTFTITVANAGPDNATNVAVSDVLPAGLAFVSAAPSQGSYNNGTGVWTVGTINSGANATLTITATVTSVGAKTNTAQVSASDQADPDSTPNNNNAGEDDQASVTLTPQVADLSLSKTVNNTTPNVGANVTFTITVTNAGPDNATNVAVSDVLPAGLAFVSANPSQGTYNSGTGVWTVGTINSGTNATLDILATVTTSGAKTNTAQVSASDQADPDSTPNNSVAGEDDQASVTLNPQTADLSLTKTVNNATPNVGANVTFTITVTNAGPDNATNVAVSDVLPAGLTFVSANPSQGAYNSGTGVWTVGTINNGANATLDIVATVTATGAKTNTAQVSASDQNDPDSTPNNNAPNEDDQASVTLTPAAALVADPALSKAGNPTQASVGDTITFTLTVTNAGNAPAPNVVVTDNLPAMFDVTAVNVSGPGSFGASVNVTPPIGTGPAPYTIEVTLNSPLGVTDVVTITITTTVNSLGNPPINNTASLTTSAQTNITSNDSDSVTITLRSSNPATAASNRPALLPATGFAPKVETKLAAQPQDMLYAATDVLLEIPSLGLKLPIVGVPKKNGTWDVSWLGKQAGWLEGSAFPSWSGNSVLTSHVYTSNGLPGPFVNLHKLKFGDQIIVNAYGQKYIFEVQTNQVVAPNDTSAFKHEEKSWLTLITCKEYDEKTDSYQKRVVVRAVLVKVVWDK